MEPDADEPCRLVRSQSQPDVVRLALEQRSNLLLLPGFPARGVEAVIDKAGNFRCRFLKHRRPCRDGDGEDIVTIGLIVGYDPDLTHAEPLSYPLLKTLRPCRFGDPGAPTPADHQCYCNSK